MFNAYGESLRETADKTDTEDFCFLREMQEEADGAGMGLAPQDKKNKKDATGKKAAAPMQAHSKAVGTRRLRMQDFVLLLADVGVVLESVRARAACERASIVPSLYLSKLAHRRASTHAHTHTFTYKHTYIQTHIHAYIYIYIYRVPSAAHQHMHTHTCRCLPSAISLVEGWGEGAGSRASAVAADGTRYMQMYMYACMCVCMYVCMYMCVYTHIHVSIFPRKYTHKSGARMKSAGGSRSKPP